MVFAEGSSNLASPMLFGTAAVQKVVPSFLVPTFCPSVMPPSPRDGQLQLLNRPGQESLADGSFIYFLLAIGPLMTLAQCGHTSFESQYF